MVQQKKYYLFSFHIIFSCPEWRDIENVVIAIQEFIHYIPLFLSMQEVQSIQCEFKIWIFIKHKIKRKYSDHTVFVKS